MLFVIIVEVLYPANIYLLKLVIKTLEKDMTYAPS